MRRVHVFKLLATIIVICSLTAAFAQSRRTIELVFDASGKLISETPNRIREGDTIQLLVQMTPKDLRQREEWLVDHLSKAVRGIDAALPETTPYGDLFGVTETQLTNAREELCGAIGQILQNARHIPRSTRASTYLASLGCQTTQSPGAFLPANYAKLGDVSTQFEWECLSPRSQPTSGASYTIPSTCSQIAFRVTRVYSYADVVDQWFASLQTEWQSVLSEVSSKRDQWKEFEQKFRACEPLIEKLEKKEAVNQADLKSKCETPLTEFQTKLADYLNSLCASLWISKWVWLTQGELYVDPAAVGRLGASLANAASTLNRLQAEVATMNKIIEHLEITDLDNPRNVIAKLAVIVAERDAQLRKVAGLRSSLADLRNRTSAGELLYEGLLVTQQGSTRAAMRHHDATRDYVLQDAELLREVDERERVVVLVANEKPGTDLSLDVETEAIEPDQTLLGEILQLSEAAAERGIQTTGSMPGMSTSNLPTIFRRAKLQLKDLQSRSALPNLPLQRSLDGTPEYQTQVVAHRIDSKVPTRVNYTIKAQPEGADEPEEVGGGEYRINRRYHMRLKTGLMYSHREKRSFTLEPDKDPVEEVSRAGIEGTFGLQFYFDKRDIRRNKNWFIPVSYLGFSVTKPTESFFAGFGWEVYSGITILGGLNFGRDQELILEEGQPPRTGRDWDHDYFYSFLVDPNVFTRIFGLADQN